MYNMLHNLSNIKYTGVGTNYAKLRGYLPEDFRVLNRKQIKRYRQAKQKLGLRENVKLENDISHNIDFRPVLVQLHRQERVLNRLQNMEYENIMRKAGYPFKK